MGYSYFCAKWKERLKMLLLLPFSNGSLKFFPPPFVLRDPVLSLVHKQRRKGFRVILILFHLREYHNILKANPFAVAERLQRRIRSVFMEVVFRHVSADQIIGIKQVNPKDTLLFVQTDDEPTFDHWHRASASICAELEHRLQAADSLNQSAGIKFQSGFFVMEKAVSDPEAAVQMAYHYALATATKKLPQHFSLYRLQLEKIIESGDITVLTQPIMNLQTGDIFGWEVLTRGPRDSVLHNPAELFAFAYQAELLPQLEFLVIHKALAEIAGRRIKEQVFINITPVSLSDPLLLDRLTNKLQRFGIPPEQVIFEITERHSIDDFEQMAGILRSYRARGFRFAVDDAGAGYSSLQSISELIPDIIKIDKSVIANIDRASVKQALLKSLLYFAENINCQVIAEGVEREEEASVLMANHVHMGQGYYFAKPEPFQQSGNPGHFLYLKEKIMDMSRKAASSVPFL